MTKSKKSPISSGYTSQALGIIFHFPKSLTQTWSLFFGAPREKVPSELFRADSLRSHGRMVEVFCKKTLKSRGFEKILTCCFFGRRQRPQSSRPESPLGLDCFFAKLIRGMGKVVLEQICQEKNTFWNHFLLALRCGDEQDSKSV